uniref:Uncharacterized protein n=1 Tax=Thermofilum pendens TaxID=2269 RepID=A0A7J3X544_THEPE
MKLFSALERELEYLGNVAPLDSRLLASDVKLRVWARLLDRRLDKLIIDLVREECESNAESILYKPVGEGSALAVALSDTTVGLDALETKSALGVARSAVTLLLTRDLEDPLRGPRATSSPPYRSRRAALARSRPRRSPHSSYEALFKQDARAAPQKVPGWKR